MLRTLVVLLGQLDAVPGSAVDTWAMVAVAIGTIGTVVTGSFSNSSPTAANEKSDGNPQPARNVRRSSTVIARAAGARSSIGLSGVRTTCGEANSGNQRATGSPKTRRPSSTSSMTAAAMTGFVVEARRTIESGSNSPALATSTWSPRATSAAAPGTVPSLTADSTRS